MTLGKTSSVRTDCCVASAPCQQGAAVAWWRRANQQGYRIKPQVREGIGLGSVWERLTACAGSSLLDTGFVKGNDCCCLRCTARAVVRAGTPHLSVTSVNVMSRTCVLWNSSSSEPASPSAGNRTTGVQRARKAAVEEKGGQRRAMKRPRTATGRFPLCCSRNALDVRISLTNVTSAGKQAIQSRSGVLCSQQGWLALAL